MNSFLKIGRKTSFWCLFIIIFPISKNLHIDSFIYHSVKKFSAHFRDIKMYRPFSVVGQITLAIVYDVKFKLMQSVKTASL